jgi:[protein-PII] uridylyltransferase
VASKTLLRAADLEALRGLLANRPSFSVGEGNAALGLYRKSLTDFITAGVLKTFRAIPAWLEARPVFLGSLARGELCPRSDVDLLFLGPDKAVKAVLREADVLGLKIGYRKPSDPEDWTRGVEFKDLLNLLHSVCEVPADRQLVRRQVELLKENKKIGRGLLRHLLKEREARTARYGGAIHFLEPNLKYSPGALRDIYQALVAETLFPRIRESHAQKILEHYRDFFLVLRVWVHAQGGGEIFASAWQMECSKWFGFSDLSGFMREVQRGFGRSRFYSDLYLEKAISGPSRVRPVGSVPEALALLMENKKLKAVGKVREFVVENSGGWNWEKAPKALKAGVLGGLTAVFRRGDDRVLQNLFRSRLMDFIFPEMKPLVGYVQHDQYHRFTADQHILQALREVASARRRPKVLGKLAALAKNFKNAEWDTLYWTALFHDMGKARAGDHSNLGADFAASRLMALGLSPDFVEEVRWLVRFHLALSTAAFRENPLDAATWHGLFEKGLNPRRLKLLTVFTAIDIRATNPDAWTGWKEDLLHNLFTALSEGPAESVRRLLEEARHGKKFSKLEGLLKDLDPFLVEAFPPRVLLKDLSSSARSRADGESFALYRDRHRRLWIRFFERRDKKGLFLSYVSRLFSAGISVHHASVHTWAGEGVYDWFCVGKTKASRVVLEKKLKHSSGGAGDGGAVKFDGIELISESSEGALLSFRGKDQKGALLAAGLGLLDGGFEILWARVHTWGREMDDQFFVRSRPDLHRALKDLRQKLLKGAGPVFPKKIF